VTQEVISPRGINEPHQHGHEERNLGTPLRVPLIASLGRPGYWPWLLALAPRRPGCRHRRPAQARLPARRPGPRPPIGRCRPQPFSCAAGADPRPPPGCPWPATRPHAWLGCAGASPCHHGDRLAGRRTLTSGGPVPISGEQVRQAGSLIASDLHATLGWELAGAEAVALRERSWWRSGTSTRFGPLTPTC
jgi:hypothetical protein